jgi:16S rRNA (cytosine967-C5)-methyltransferase
VKPGGTLVYSTCTVLPEENEWIVEAFLKRAPNFALTAADALPAEVQAVIGPDGALRCLPHRHDADGFYAARLERSRE